MKQVWDIVAATIKGTSSEVAVPSISGTQLVNNTLNVVYFIAGFVAIGMIIYAGIRYMNANGEVDRIKAAHRTLSYGIAGLIIVALAFAITAFVISRVKG